MRIKLDTVILGQDGPIVDNGVPFTMRAVLVGALLNAPDSMGLSGDEKNERYKLAMRIKSSLPYIELPLEQVAELKRLVGISFSVIVVGRVFDILDPGEPALPPEVP